MPSSNGCKGRGKLMKGKGTAKPVPMTLEERATAAIHKEYRNACNSVKGAERELARVVKQCEQFAAALALAPATLKEPRAMLTRELQDLKRDLQDYRYSLTDAKADVRAVVEEAASYGIKL